MKNKSIKLVAASIFSTSLAFWTGSVEASIDPNPMPHDSDLTIQRDVFPTPAALKDNVAFWRKVFAEWRLNQVVLHDADYPGLVYEVVDLEGETVDSFTSAQREQIERRREALEQRLERLAAARDNASGLSDEDRSLRQTIIDVAGKEALSDASSRVRVQRGLRERFQQGLEISGRYDRAFREVFREEGVPEDLAYLPHVESSFQNRARSSVGAAGMWQFTRSAGRLFLKINHAVDQRMDPVAAARGAARYLRQAYEMLGDWPLAITSYNHGIQGMKRARDQYGNDFSRIVREYDSRTFGFASRNFYAEFLAVRDIARNREQYFPEGVALQRPLALDSVVLDKPLRAHELANYYAVKRAELVSLNPSWSQRAARGDVAIPSGALVWLPAGTLSKPAEVKSVATADAAQDVTPGSESSDQPMSAAQPVTVSAPSPVSVFHIVRANENLSTIAKHYGLSLPTLRALNDMAPRKDLVRIGQKLRVRDAVEPVVGQVKEGDMIIHVVREGDNPWVIAANYGISVKELLTVNQLTKRSVLRPGQRLGIPKNR